MFSIIRRSVERTLLAVAAIAAVTMAQPVRAADLPARMHNKAPPIVDPVYNWNGFYIGGNLGYSWGRSRDDSSLANGAGTVLYANSGRSDLDGVVGGGQIGYNWQTQNWLWGLEADIQGTGERGSRSFICPIGVCTPATGGFAAVPVPGPAVPVSLDQKLEWFGTVRGRVGVLATRTC